MPKVSLGYGKSSFEFDLDVNRFLVLGEKRETKRLSDVEIGQRFDSPVGSKTIEEIVTPGESVLIVVPDATRSTAAGQIVNLLVRRLIAGGTMPYDIRIIFATGIHRKVTDAEKQQIVTPFIAQRIKMLDHDARDLAQLVDLGDTSDGIKIRLNRALLEHDHIFTVGGVNFHYFAGFTGGRKLVCPGLASSQTISATHKLAFDCETRSRRNGVGAGQLEGNPVHNAFMEIVEKTPPTFSINTVVDHDGFATEVFAGDWKRSHFEACKSLLRSNIVSISEKRDLVVVSCGGAPHDINLIQAHKALDAASAACTDGGTILFLAECGNGTGRDDFLNWFEVENSDKLAEKLCENYRVNGQTAWSLLRKTERFKVRILTSMPENETRLLRMQKARNAEELFFGIENFDAGYIIPFGAKTLIKLRL